MSGCRAWLTRALSRSQKMLEPVAVCVDNLKTENLCCQTEQVKEEDGILYKKRAVVRSKNTVATEMRSWSDTVKNNYERSSSVTPKI